MAKQKLSQRDIISIKTGGYVHIILPAITPGEFNSYRIPVASLLAGEVNTPITQTGVTGNITQAIAANTFIQRISLFHAGGTPTVRVGTTPNGEQILPDTLITDFIPIPYDVHTSAGMTLYFTINSGSIDIRIDVTDNYKPA